MDRRTKILAGGFGAVIAFVMLARVVYPGWIRPLLTIDDRVREKQDELAKLEEVQAAVDKARIEYRDFVARTGSFDFGKVETAIRDRLNTLIEKHKLENANTAPSRPVEDRKTGLTKSVITVTAVGSLESAVNFMKDVAEMPELVRLGNPTLSPASSGRRADAKDKINMRVPIDVLVLPKNKTAGTIEPGTLAKVDSFVRHAGQEYSLIWERTPFTPYVELQPLRVDAQRMLNVEVGQQGILQATATGGDGNYTFTWSPPEGLTDPSQARTVVDTSAPRTQTYTVSVVDTVKDRQPVTATVAVSVKEPKPRVEPTPTQAPPTPTQPVVVAPPTWPDAKLMTVVMTLLRSAGTSRTNELMVTNSRTRETTYHKVMDDFDGGKLVFVHQTGGVVWRAGKYYVYPLGSQLGDCIEHTQAEAYPELKTAAERAIALQTAQAEAKKKAPPAEVVPGNDPTLDSRGAEPSPAAADPAPSGGDPTVPPPALGDPGPVVPPVTKPEETGPSGPGNPSEPSAGANTVPSENPQANPPTADPVSPTATQNPQNQPAQPGNDAQQPPRTNTKRPPGPNRPRPKGRGPGRV